MIKVYNFKKILQVIVVITIILFLFIILKNKSKGEEITVVSSNNNCKYEILVDVEESKLYLFENGIPIKTYKCSGGKWSTPSPIGKWKIVQKAKWGEGFRWKLDAELMCLGEILEYTAHLIQILLVGQVRMDV